MSAPLIFTASLHTTECVPAAGSQWNLTKRDSPAAFTKRKACTPKPCIVRRLRAVARSDISHISVWLDSGISETKSQKASCALAACGMPLCGSGFTAWIRSGNLI